MSFKKPGTLEIGIPGTPAPGSGEAESAAQAGCQTGRSRRSPKPATSVRRQAAEELEPQFQQRLAEASGAPAKQSSPAEDEFKGAMAEATGTAERRTNASNTGTARAVARLCRGAATTGGGTSQSEILSRSLQLADPFADRFAIYVSKADGLALWKERGKAAFPAVISQETTDPDSTSSRSSFAAKRSLRLCSAPFRIDALDFLRQPGAGD